MHCNTPNKSTAPKTRAGQKKDVKGYSTFMILNEKASKLNTKGK